MNLTGFIPKENVCHDSPHFSLLLHLNASHITIEDCATEGSISSFLKNELK